MNDILDLAARHCCSYGKDGNDFVFDKTQLLAFVADLATHAGAAAEPRLTPEMIEHLKGGVAEAEAIDGNLKALRARLAALTSAPAVPEAPDFEQMRARTLLAHLWRRYDAAGTSMGRSHEAVVLEAVLSLLGDPDRVDMALLDKDSGHFINATRDYLSGKMRERLFGKGVQPGERGEG